LNFYNSFIVQAQDMEKNDLILSICIPTYNGMPNILKSLKYIEKAFLPYNEHLEICISDNGSDDDTFKNISQFMKVTSLKIKIHHFVQNEGFDRNILKVLDMSKGKFAWLFGDDEFLIKKEAIKVFKLLSEIQINNDVLLYQVGVISYTKEKKFRKKIVSKKENEILKSEAIFQTPAFISTIIFNKMYIDEILSSNQNIVQDGINCQYIHEWIIRLSLLKINHLKIMKLPFTAILSKPSWQENRQLISQIRFMFESIKRYNIFLIDKNYRLIYYKLKFLHFLHIMFDLILARMFCKNKFDIKLIKLILNQDIKFHILIIFYLILYLIPNRFITIFYNFFKKFIFLFNIKTELDLSETEKKWKEYIKN